MFFKRLIIGLFVFLISISSLSLAGCGKADNNDSKELPKELAKKNEAPAAEVKKELKVEKTSDATQGNQGSSVVRDERDKGILRPLGIDFDEIDLARRIVENLDLSEFDNIERILRKRETVEPLEIQIANRRIGTQIAEALERLNLAHVDEEIVPKIKAYIGLHAFLVLKEDDFYSGQYSELNLMMYKGQEGIEEKIKSTKKKIGLLKDTILLFNSIKAKSQQEGSGIRSKPQ